MKNLINTKSLSKENVINIFKEASIFKKTTKQTPFLKGKFVATLFYEPSTRTRISFEIAAKKLGAEVINIEINSSSITKGETVCDTIETLKLLGVEIFIIRHKEEGLVENISKHFENTSLHFVNAGDGMNEHPSQALIDLFTLKESSINLDEKNICIIGDSLHSRVARSNTVLLKNFGLNVYLYGPYQLLLKGAETNGAKVVASYEDLKKVKIDFFMALRIQKERQVNKLINSNAEYASDYCLDEKFIKDLGLNLEDLRILHPGPVNRGIEISDSLVDNEYVSLIKKQVENGLFIRMAILLGFFK